jgi:hypothetical protein
VRIRSFAVPVRVAEEAVVFRRRLSLSFDEEVVRLAVEATG